jgi:hypothetical protein
MMPTFAWKNRSHKKSQDSWSPGWDLNLRLPKCEVAELLYLTTTFNLQILWDIYVYLRVKKG